MEIVEHTPPVINPKARYGSDRDFCLPHLHLKPLLGGGFLSGYCHKVLYRKLECCGYPMVKKFWKCVYSRAVKHCNHSKCRHKTWQVCSWDQMEVEFKGGCDTVTRWVADGVIPSPMNSSSCCCCCCCCCNQKASISLMLWVNICLLLKLELCILSLEPVLEYCCESHAWNCEWVDSWACQANWRCKLSTTMNSLPSVNLSLNQLKRTTDIGRGRFFLKSVYIRITSVINK